MTTINHSFRQDTTTTTGRATAELNPVHRLSQRLISDGVVAGYIHEISGRHWNGSEARTKRSVQQSAAELRAAA